MKPLPASHSPEGPPPNWKQRKLAGNGPATSSLKSTFSGDLASLRVLRAARERDGGARLGAVDRRVGAAAEQRAHRARVRAVGVEERVVVERVAALGADAVLAAVLEVGHAGPVGPRVAGALAIAHGRGGDLRVVRVVAVLDLVRVDADALGGPLEELRVLGGVREQRLAGAGRLDLRGGGLCQGHGARHRAEADQSGSHGLEPASGPAARHSGSPVNQKRVLPR